MYVETAVVKMFLKDHSGNALRNNQNKVLQKTITSFVNGGIEHEQEYIHVSFKELFCTVK